jgi:NADPH-dependent glutamate synthase beta subunit-like oxidoreductase
MPKRKFKSLRQSEDEVRDAAETLARKARTRSFMTPDQIRVLLSVDPVEFSDEDNDNLEDIDIEDSEEEDEEEEDEEEKVIQIKEVDLPPPLIEKVGTYSQ